MQLPERRPHRLARHFLPPLVEHPDDPVLRLLVVLGPHASFSPCACKESLNQSQGGSEKERTHPHPESAARVNKPGRATIEPTHRRVNIRPALTRAGEADVATPERMTDRCA